MDINKTAATAVFGLLMSFSSVVFAEGFSYNWVELASTKNRFSSGGDSSDKRIGINAEISSHVFLGFAYVKPEDQVFAGNTIENSSLAYLLGYHTPLEKDIDLLVSGSYTTTKATLNGATLAEGDGRGISVGLRALATPSVEISGFFGRSEFEGQYATGYFIGAFYYFTRDLALGVGLGKTEDTKSQDLNFRIYF